MMRLTSVMLRSQSKAWNTFFKFLFNLRKYGLTKL